MHAYFFSNLDDLTEFRKELHAIVDFVKFLNNQFYCIAQNKLSILKDNLDFVDENSFPFPIVDLREENGMVELFDGSSWSTLTKDPIGLDLDRVINEHFKSIRIKLKKVSNG